MAANGLTPEQRRVLTTIATRGHRKGASPMELKAAVAIGLVESNLTNLRGGDRDSAGWRQERASLYKDPTNLNASVDRVFDEMRALRGKYGDSGELAAAVQRPAAQYRGRYAQRGAEAERLLRLVGSRVNSEPPVGSIAFSGGSAPSPMTTPAGSTRDDLLKQYISQRGQPGALLGLGQQLGSLQAPAAPAGSAVLPRSAVDGTVALGGTAATRGSVKITGPNPGRIKPQVLDFMEKISSIYGKPLVGSDGTGHSRLTTSGNVSQHTTGNAVDIPMAGRELLRAGRAALIAAGMPRAQALKANGGLYNVGSHQIIFLTNEGGNHYDHLHVSAR